MDKSASIAGVRDSVSPAERMHFVNTDSDVQRGHRTDVADISYGIALKAEVFYIDTENITDRKRKILELQLDRVGAKVERFLSREVTCVITGNNDLRHNKSTKISVDSSNVGSPCSAVLSRGKALLMKSNASAIDSSGGRSRASIPVAFAKQWSIKIMTIGNLLNCVRRELIRSGQLVRSSKKSIKTKSKKLAGAFVKFQDCNQLYRPSWKILKMFPSVDVDPDAHPEYSPFERNCNKNKYVHKNDSASIHHVRLKSGNPQTMSNVKKECKGKSMKRMRKEPGFCECCDVYFTDLHQHLTSESHLMFSANKENFSLLDSLVSMMPSLACFEGGTLLEKSAHNNEKSDSWKSPNNLVVSLNSTGTLSQSVLNQKTNLDSMLKGMDEAYTINNTGGMAAAENNHMELQTCQLVQEATGGKMERSLISQEATQLQKRTSGHTDQISDMDQEMGGKPNPLSSLHATGVFNNISEPGASNNGLNQQNEMSTLLSDNISKLIDDIISPSAVDIYSSTPFIIAEAHQPELLEHSTSYNFSQEVLCGTAIKADNQESYTQNPSHHLEQLLSWSEHHSAFKDHSLGIVTEVKAEEFSELSCIGDELHKTCTYVLDILKSDSSYDQNKPSNVKLDATFGLSDKYDSSLNVCGTVLDNPANRLESLDKQLVKNSIASLPDGACFPSHHVISNKSSISDSGLASKKYYDSWSHFVEYKGHLATDQSVDASFIFKSDHMEQSISKPYIKTAMTRADVSARTKASTLYTEQKLTSPQSTTSLQSDLNIAASFISLSKLRIFQDVTSSQQSHLPFEIQDDEYMQLDSELTLFPENSGSTDLSTYLHKENHKQSYHDLTCAHTSSKKQSNSLSDCSSDVTMEQHTDLDKTESAGFVNCDLMVPVVLKKQCWTITRADNLTLRLNRLPERISAISEQEAISLQSSLCSEAFLNSQNINSVSDQNADMIRFKCSSGNMPSSISSHLCTTPRNKQPTPQITASWKVQRSGDCKLKFCAKNSVSHSNISKNVPGTRKRSLFK
ncbi:hypothetical protein LSH36_209g01021 [Paralvinella palmiformis]|uniref:DBF4-type domain-containing protein n=1 Tax=Paralvinella palmiformis TaxID=53620 RepID=A0AAD9N495_9ANNE|nr:hypothetical protein LSH36_209g01021 [Paralvinella palmiformis]